MLSIAHRRSNFGRLVLLCIDSYDSEQRRIFLHFSRSARFASFCTILTSEILQENMRLTAFFKLYKICILLHRFNLGFADFKNHFSLKIFFFALFMLAGWSKRAIIARGSQRGSKDLVAISLSLSLSLSEVSIQTRTDRREFVRPSE